MDLSSVRVRKATFVHLLLSLLMLTLFLALPVAQFVAYAQVPTKTPIEPAQTAEPTAEPTDEPSPLTLPTVRPTLTAIPNGTNGGDQQQVSGPGVLSITRPLLGMELLEFQDAPDYFQESTLGGGDLLVNVQDGCAVGYTSAPSTLGLALIDSMGPVQVGFESLNGDVPIAIAIWEDLQTRWWCNDGFAPGNFFEFTTLGEGLYFVWVLGESGEAIPGNIFVRQPVQP